MAALWHLSIAFDLLFTTHIARSGDASPLRVAAVAIVVACGACPIVVLIVIVTIVIDLGLKPMRALVRRAVHEVRLPVVVRVVHLRRHSRVWRLRIHREAQH